MRLFFHLLLFVGGGNGTQCEKKSDEDTIPNKQSEPYTSKQESSTNSLPVTAEAHTSLPAKADGITDAWMGVGETKPMEATPRSSGRERPS